LAIFAQKTKAQQERFETVNSTSIRESAIIPERSALLFIDVQNYNARPDGGMYNIEQGLKADQAEAKYAYFFRQLTEIVIPNIQRLQLTGRARGIEVMYTVIESLTKDGRDRSLDYKITGFNVPKGFGTQKCSIRYVHRMTK
jgi:ureidoacrylate peracid hydrolase